MAPSNAAAVRKWRASCTRGRGRRRRKRRSRRTKSNEAEGAKQIRELRRLFETNILGALPMRAGRSWSLDLSGQTSRTARVHPAQEHRTHVGAAFRPTAELDPGAIIVKNRLGSRYCDANEGGISVAPKNWDLAHAA